MVPDIFDSIVSILGVFELAFCCWWYCLYLSYPCLLLFLLFFCFPIINFVLDNEKFNDEIKGSLVLIILPLMLMYNETSMFCGNVLQFDIHCAEFRLCLVCITPEHLVERIRDLSLCVYSYFMSRRRWRSRLYACAAIIGWWCFIKFEFFLLLYCIDDILL